MGWCGGVVFESSGEGVVDPDVDEGVGAVVGDDEFESYFGVVVGVAVVSPFVVVPYGLYDFDAGVFAFDGGVVCVCYLLAGVLRVGGNICPVDVDAGADDGGVEFDVDFITNGEWTGEGPVDVFVVSRIGEFSAFIGIV